VQVHRQASISSAQYRGPVAVISTIVLRHCSFFLQIHTRRFILGSQRCQRVSIGSWPRATSTSVLELSGGVSLRREFRNGSHPTKSFLRALPRNFGVALPPTPMAASAAVVGEGVCLTAAAVETAARC